MTSSVAHPGIGCRNAECAGHAASKTPLRIYAKSLVGQDEAAERPISKRSTPEDPTPEMAVGVISRISTLHGAKELAVAMS
ncbi:hypothetical protein ABZT47_15550 [Sphaerisporangium sp. NPDC005289]|uniref:hypothetical protein n=1 Tax=Sphaerisporangium sp. NPDC005289 TaxID=3155247 RepID=UPI0033BDC86F